MKRDQILNLDGTRMLAWLMLVIFSSGILLPGTSYAGGPGQPEASGFTPVGVSDMVDPFTGDFTYNIPLMDVEGYPINIAYHSGITMDQEASWVGLGWNLNVGSVVRNMSGVPDDFNGDQIVKVTHQRPNRTYTINGKLGIELFGKSNKSTDDESETVTPPSISVALGIGYNNYTGYSTNFSISPSFGQLSAGGHSLTGGFSLGGSSENGASFSPQVSYEHTLKKKGMFDRSMVGTVGSSFNSRAGLSYISYTVGIKRSAEIDEKTRKAKPTSAKQDFVSNTLRDGISGSFNLGLASYSPSASNSMRNLSVTGSWKTGFTLFGADATSDIGFTYSTQWIAKDDERLESPAYGYFHLGAGQSVPKAILDFNRDNEGSFTPNTPFIASAHLTNDLYSLNAQGISGSYRGFRNDVGYVFDPQVKTISASGSAGLETGIGNAAKVGLDIAYNHTSAETGGWVEDENHAFPSFKFSDNNPAPVYEHYAMQEANERSVNQDPLFATKLGGDQPVRFEMGGNRLSPKLNHVLQGPQVSNIDAPTNRRTMRHKRNQVMQFLTHEELAKGYGLNLLAAHVESRDHHVGQITQTGTDGRRYVFGIAAYNILQEEVTFSTGKKINGDAGLSPANYFNGLIGYEMLDASAVNDYGLDNYYSSTITPGYAHSHLLTAVLSDDYIDSDGQKGPTQNDLGTYVKFDYVKKVENHKWRTPAAANQAFRNEGLKVDESDDKASFVYGEKELWYIRTVETKNYVAVFETLPRTDGRGVMGNNGGVGPSASAQHLLRKISLYSKPDYIAHGNAATAIQQVHFVYSYELCEGYPGNPGGVPAVSPDAGGNGKLTLKQIYFTYQGSNRMKQSPYKFHYDGDKPTYQMKSVDRWGNYKPSPSGSGPENPLSAQHNNADFPYTDQDPANTNDWVASWSMTGISLPSGGFIKVEYESDDYAYVQNKKAMRMFPIVLVEGTDGNTSAVSLLSVSDPGNKNRKIYFKPVPGHLDIDEYIRPDQYMYFRCLTSFVDGVPLSDPHKYEYVSGYGKVSTATMVDVGGGEILGMIELQGCKLMDNGAGDYSPIAKAGIQFGRMHLSKKVNQPITATNSSDTEQGFLDFAGTVVGAVASFKELFKGPNLPIWDDQLGTQILTQKSFIRLQEPTGCKLGGGSRVSKIIMSDNWDAMSGMAPSEYGQEFHYKNIDGTSSGVASYEPQAGGDENPWHQPLEYKNGLRMSPDENLYMEYPLMESLFPSPSVGYSRVTIKDIKPTNVTRTGTGKVVKEFFTAKDFPTITKATGIEPLLYTSFMPVIPKVQNVTVTQGFSIELNDMHGKPSREEMYAENNNKPFSTVDYYYKHQLEAIDGELGKKLVNQATVIYPNGTSGTAEIGVKYEAVADFRQSNTKSLGGALQMNLNSFAAVGFFIVPTAWPSIDASSNKFRSAGFNKVINRFGILERTVANQDGSIVETKNVAYDSETGEVLLTETTTNFNDQVYSMNYPAYWGYDQLGGAYKNIDVEIEDVNLNSNGYVAVENAPNHFTEGDELEVYTIVGVNCPTPNCNTAVKGWVSAVSSAGINIIDEVGNPIQRTVANVKVIRSGRKNKQSVSMASITTLENPMTALASNKYNKVLNAGAVEFGQDWKTYCNCFGATTSNPFVLGVKGNWRPVKSYTYLSGRTHTNLNGNTQIRKDGVFTGYSPYYKNQGGKWKEDGLNWTYVSQVTEFSPNGMTLETKDALDRFSATTFGFNNTLTTAVAANTRLTELAFASFEDADFTNCADAHFKIPGTVEKMDAHTGRNSLKVVAGSSATYNTAVSGCVVLTCDDLKINFEDIDPDLQKEAYTILNGAGPYQLEMDVVNGTADASISGNTLHVNGSGSYVVQVTIIDSKGCKLVTTLNAPQR